MVVMWDGRLVGWKDVKLVEKTVLRKVDKSVEMSVPLTVAS